MVSPDKDTIKRKRSVHYTDESYEELPGMEPDELRQLNRMQENADRATDSYEELADVERELHDEVQLLWHTKVKIDGMVMSFKEYLDLKYRT